MSTEQTDHQPIGATVQKGEATSPIELLQRWEEFGGAWRVVLRTSSEVTVVLCRCDGGEEADRLVSPDPELRAWLGDKTTSHDR